MIQNYFSNINRLYQTQNAREHSYRGHLETLLNNIIDDNDIIIGGYQPAQKWLKNRVGRELSRTDLKHYNKIINALVGTDKLMKEIDEVLKV